MLITAAAGPDAALVAPEPLPRNRNALISVTNGGGTLRRARARRAARQAPG